MPDTQSAAEAPQDGTLLRVLLVEDSKDDAELVTAELRRGGYAPRVTCVEDAAAMSAALQQPEWDLVICDYSLPRFSGPAALRVLHASGLDLPFIIVSGDVGEEFAVEMMRAGAHDYLMKDRLARLVPAVTRELRDAAMRRERARAEAEGREEAEITAAIARVSEALISSLDTPRLLESLCRLTTEVLQCDVSRTWLWHSKDDAYVAVSSYGDPPEEREATRVLRLPRAVMSELLVAFDQQGVVQIVMGDYPSREIPALARDLGITVVLYLPLRRGANLIGFQTAAHRSRGRRFTRQQQRLGAGIAHLASLALANAQLVEELERASRIKSDFVATMSHELRTPLNVIIGYGMLLLDGEFGPLTPEQAETLRKVDKRSQELLELINATLNLSRIENGRLPLEIAEVGLHALLDQLESETRAAISRPGVEVVWQRPARAVVLRTDAVKLKVVIKNLVTNALKFTEHGRITISTALRDGGVEITVYDTGIGIPLETRAVIFEPFRQGDSSSTRRYGGVGLGLYIARRLTEALGGTIAVESEVDRGSTFRVWIPERLDAEAPMV
ncbi:MAG TPA: hybrid sensor histidine kinase/response regulator [Candidatus Binatia bacterium]|nr:hybrid sensor histidine kinase/response regulator [Candidatus Binatia bacterium]